MRNQYVNITRARESVKIFTDDKKYLKELSEIKTHARDTLSLAHTFDEAKENAEKVKKNELIIGNTNSEKTNIKQEKVNETVLVRELER